MKNLTALLQHLTQYIEQQQQEYADLLDKIIYTPLDLTLFSENEQPLRFYFAEMQQNLKQLAKLKEQELIQIEFLTNKILNQATVLQDAVFQLQKIKQKSAVNLVGILNKREQRRQQIERLPPRERLTEYYTALQALNDKLTHLKDQLKQSRESALQEKLQQQIDITKQRRMKCLNAIEILEDYLRFKQEQEDKNNL